MLPVNILPLLLVIFGANFGAKAKTSIIAYKMMTSNFPESWRVSGKKANLDGAAISKLGS